jgi:hypothetical protein
MALRIRTGEPLKLPRPTRRTPAPPASHSQSTSHVESPPEVAHLVIVPTDRGRQEQKGRSEA